MTKEKNIRTNVEYTKAVQRLRKEIDAIGFTKYIEAIENVDDGYRITFKFDNSYGASVTLNSGSYGSEDNMFELVVMKDGVWCFETPVTSGAEGYLPSDAVIAYLRWIKSIK